MARLSGLWRAWPQAALDLAGRNATGLTDALLNRRLRLAVTGLRHAGKTVFTTALTYHLLQGTHLPFLHAARDNRLLGARLDAPPGGLAAFPYRAYVEALTGALPHFPEATAALSGLTLNLSYVPRSLTARTLSPVAKLKLEIVDYPGEWLLDLPLLQQDFPAWSAQQFALAEHEPRRSLIDDYLAFTRELSRLETVNDADLRLLGQHFTDYLHACQRAGLSFLQPGRFTMPGAEANDTLLAFGPWPGDLPAPAPLADALARRYRRYVEEAVRPFYQRHFKRFDRQIVLIDLLSALNGGAGHFADTQAALDALLGSFHYGANSWLTRLIEPKIDRVLFAASKADHVSANQHPNLKHLLARMVEEAVGRARYSGAAISTAALAALRCTDSVKTDYQGQSLSCVRGTLKHERRETVLYPGEIPPDLPETADWQAGRFDFKAFAPRGLGTKEAAPLRLDAALDFLIGDRLA